jgi:hypothetical protein
MDDVRARALQAALEIHLHSEGPQLTVERVLETARRIEAYLRNDDYSRTAPTTMPVRELAS